MSPTSVYSRRSSEPSRAAAASPGRQADAEPEGVLARAPPPFVDLVLGLVHGRRRGQGPVGVVVLRDRRAEHGHDRVADELHHGAVLAEDGAVHRGPVLVELARRARVDGVRSAMPE